MTVFFVIGTIIIFLTIEAVLHRARDRRGMEKAAAALPGREQTYPVRLPDGIFFARSHTWLNLFPSGKICLGVDDFVGRLLKKPEVVLLKAAGSKVRKGDPILMLREGDRSLTIRAPMDGEILTANNSIREHPELLKEMLFTDGWAYMLKPRKPSQLRQMLLGEETRQWIAQEFARLRELFTQEASSKVAPALLQDGGPAVDGALEAAERHTWELFDRMFLSESE
jgi:glycine cleavage system H lipoate-binding protein